MIVSNRRTSTQEMDTLMPEVRQRPGVALYGGEDGLDFYRLIRGAGAYLSDGRCCSLNRLGAEDAVSALLARHIGEPLRSGTMGQLAREWAL